MTGLLVRLAEHWQLKLLSVVFAVALWAFVASDDRTEAVYTVPLSFVGVPPGLAVTTVADEVVDVRVRALRGVLARLAEEQLRAEVSLQGARPGEFVVRVLPRNVKAPRGVQVVRVTPPRVRGTLQRPAKAPE